MSDVRSVSAAVEAMGKHWPMVRALLGGTPAMREGGTTYLPKWPGEEQSAYDARLKTATLYPAYSRTVEVLAGKPFSKALTFDESTPERITEWMKDCDLQGNNLHSFASELMTEVIGYGLSGILVDYPRADNVRTLADERAAGARPYFTRYSPGTILGWKTARINGVLKLTQLRLLETYEEDDGEFGTKECEQVRLLTPGAWAIYRKDESPTGKGSWGVASGEDNKPMEGTTSLQEIPFVFFYGKRSGYGTSAIPLLDLAYQNIEHWQSASDQQTITHVARVPILTMRGVGTEFKLAIGAMTAVNLGDNPDAKMEFVEHSGAAIQAGKQSLEDLEERMRQTGAELLVIRPGKITATQSINESESNKSALQRIVEGVEDGLDQCLQFVADWVGDQDGGSVTLFKDFSAGTLAEASGELLLNAANSGKVSGETLFKEFQRRGTIGPDVIWEDEQERIENEGPALGTIGIGNGE